MLIANSMRILDGSGIPWNHEKVNGRHRVTLRLGAARWEIERAGMPDAFEKAANVALLHSPELPAVLRLL